MEGAFMNNKSGSEQRARIILGCGGKSPQEQLEAVCKLIDNYEAESAHLQKLCEEQKAELDEMNALIALQRTRYGVAEQWWRSRKPVERELQSPDLGQLLDELMGVIEEQKGEIAELKFVLMQRDAELTMRNEQLEKVRFQSDIYAKQVVLKEELINERSSQLATQTERVRVLEEALGVALRELEHESSNRGTRLEVAVNVKKALNQDRSEKGS